MKCDWDEMARERMIRDLGDERDDAKVSVRAGDLRGLLRWAEDAAEAEPAQDAYKRGFDDGWEAALSDDEEAAA